MTNQENRKGKIITFYSHKGGTGRKMALANIGVLLSRGGNKTLLIDWDLEAPGLHRYFHKNLTGKIYSPDSSPGLIDMLLDFQKDYPRKIAAMLTSPLCQKIMTAQKYKEKIDPTEKFNYDFQAHESGSEAPSEPKTKTKKVKSKS